MATLYFKVSSDYQEVIRLRQECEKLEAQLKKMDVNKSPAAAKALETQLASTRQQMMGLVTEAAKAGAVMENDLKKKLNSASKASDELTEEIIKQRKIIRDTQDDVRRLSDEYSKMGKYSPNSKAKLAELNTAKAALNEQRYSLGELQDQQARNRLEVRKLTREYKEFASGTNNADEIVKSLTDSLKRTAAEIGGLVAIKKFGSDVIEATGKMQQLQVALSTILQDKSKADQLIADIVQFAAKTPFNLDDVATGAKQLLAYGSSADNVVNELSMLGDVASGLQIPIGQLIYLYGTLRTQGRAMTVDIRQFAGRGIPIYEELAKVLGVSKDQVGELVKEGKVGFKEVEQAFKNMTSEGGKFANLMESSAGTWPQRLSNIEDTLFQKMNEFGNKYKEVFEFGIGTAEDLVESLDDVLSVMGGLIAAYGTYKAALITAAVAQKAVGFVESIRLIGMYRKELGLATAAQQAFNVASKSNVYVTLLATLVGIGTAVYMFTKRTNEAAAAQDTLNSVNKKADEEFTKQAATIDRLSSVLKSETSSLDQKKKALSDLQSIIPSYNASLDEEGKLINNNTEAIKSYLAQLEKQIRMKAAQEELEELYRKKRTQEKQQKLATENYNEAKSLYNSSVTMTSSALQNRGINTGVTVFSQNSAVNNQLKDSANKAKKELDSVNKELGETVSAITELEKEIEKSSLSDKKEGSQSNITKEIDSVTKRINTLKKEIEGLRSGNIQAEVGKTVESTIDAKEKELKSAEKTLETLTGVRSKDVSKENSVTSADAKLSDLMRKQTLERAKEAVDLENQVEQARIDAMTDGSEKILAQRKLDNKKELQAIDKAKEAYIQKEIQRQKEIFEATEELKAKQNQKYKKRSFDSSSVSVDTSVFDSIYSNTQKRQIQDNLKAQEDAWNEALIKFGDYNQKRKAIIEKYNKEIAQAQNAGEEWAKTEEKKAALEELDEQYGKSSRVMADLFEDAGEKSVTAIQKIIDKYETLVKYLSGTEQSDGTPVTLDELKAIGFTNKDIESIERGEISIRDLTDALKNLNGELEGKSPWMSFVNDMQKSIGKIKSAKGDSEKIGEGVMGIGNAVTDFAPALGEFAENIGSIFGVDGEKIQGIVGSIQGLGQTATGVGQILSGDIVGGAMSAVGGISKVVSSLDNLFGADYSEYENMKAQYDTLISVWDTLIGKKTEYIDIDYGIEAQKAAEEAIRLTETQIERQRQLANMLAGSGASAGSHSLGYRVNDRMNSQDWQRLSGIVGQDVGSLGDVLALDADVIGNVLQDERFVSVLTEVNSEFIDYISNIGEYAEQLEEIAEKEKEALTGVGLDDFRNGYTDLLADLDSDNQDFADDFEKYLQNAIFSSLVANKYKERIEKLYNQWADYTDSGGKLTGDEADRLRNEYQNIVDDMLAEREQIMKEFGWNSSSSGQQSASSRGFGTEMTHEDAGELSGRFTAVYESNLRIETAEQQQTVAITELRGSIGPLTSQVTGLYNIADETRTILANSYLELQQIRENTEDSAKYLKDIKADISEVKRNTSRL